MVNYEIQFKKVFKTTPRSYLLKLRVQKACRELLAPHFSLTEIAIDLGFCDQSAFTAVFKKQTGVTPLKYREKYHRAAR